MRTTTILIAVCMLSAMGLTMYAQAPRDIVPVMKEGVGPTKSALDKDFTAKANDSVAKDAEKMQGLFKEVGVFMKAQKQTPAVGWANDAVSASVDLAKAAKANDVGGMTSAKDALYKTCTTCHAVHREMTGGVAKYKPAP